MTSVGTKRTFQPLLNFRFLIQSGHSGDFPRDTNHVVLERVGALDSDRWGSASFSVAEGANGGDASAPVIAMICCWYASPSAMIRSNAPLAQSWYAWIRSTNVWVSHIRSAASRAV